MSRDPASFVFERTPLWQELSRKLSTDGHLWKLPPSEISRTAALYRAVSTDLMRARTLGCTRDVIAYLDALTAQAHNALYAASRNDGRLTPSCTDSSRSEGKREPTGNSPSTISLRSWSLIWRYSRCGSIASIGIKEVR